jgi:hypothetical protein
MGILTENKWICIIVWHDAASRNNQGFTRCCSSGIKKMHMHVNPKQFTELVLFIFQLHSLLKNECIALLDNLLLKLLC